MNVPSIWEDKHFTDFDVIIVGGGLSGLATAISILEKTQSKSGGILPFPTVKLAVLERYLTPSGASSKNAGFTVFTEYTEFLDDINNMGEQKAVEVTIKRYEGLKLLIERILKMSGDSQLQPQAKAFPVQDGFEILGRDSPEATQKNRAQHLFSQNGFYEVIREEELHTLERFDYANSLLFPYFKQNVFTRCDELIPRFGFSSEHAKALVKVSFCGSVDSGWLLQSLSRYASYLGAQIYTNTEFTNFSRKNDKKRNLQVQVRCLPGKGLPARQNLTCDKLIFCTNSFTKEHFPNEKIVPGRGQILLTRPIEGLDLQGTFGLDNGYFYFKNIGRNQILIGGGRNLDFKGEETFNFGNSDKIIRAIRDTLARVLGRSLDEIRIEKKWSGIMAFSPNLKEYKTWLVKKHSANVFIGARLAGMGISLSSRIGDQMADLVLKELQHKPKL